LKRRPSTDDGGAKSPPASAPKSPGVQRPKTPGLQPPGLQRPGSAKRTIMGGGNRAAAAAEAAAVAEAEDPEEAEVVPEAQQADFSSTMPLPTKEPAAKVGGLSRSGRFGLDLDALEVSVPASSSSEGRAASDADSIPPAKWVETLEGGDEDRSIEVMKVICEEMASNTRSVASQSNELVRLLTQQTKIAFARAIETDNVRWCKYVLNTLMQIFSRKQVAEAVRQVVLQGLICELMDRMLDERTPIMKDGSNMIKALNLLMLRILDHCKKNSTLAVLLQLLRPRSSTLQKNCDLIVRCLLRMSKSLNTDFDSLDLDMLFEEIQNFFIAVPPVAKDSNTNEAMALRTVKTLVNEVVRIKGPSVRNHLSRVAEKENSPILIQYIDIMLENSQGALSESSKSSMQNVSCPHELKTIFTQFENAQQAEDEEAQAAVLAALQAYRKANPKVDVEKHLASCISPQCHGFIRGLLDSSSDPGSRVPLQNKQSSEETDENVAKNYLSRLQTLQSRYGFKPGSTPGKETAEKDEEPEPNTEDLTNKYKDRLKYLQDRYGFSKGSEAEAPNSGAVDVQGLKDRVKDFSASVGSPPAPTPAPAPAPAPVQAEVPAPSPQIAKAAAAPASVADLRARLNRVKGLQ